MIMIDLAKAKFKLGRTVMTQGVATLMTDSALEINDALQKHITGDWGVLDKEDSAMNDRAVESGEDRILSKYRLTDGTHIYIITEWDRSVTTILLPEEY
jgi:hypothetical protein